MAESENDIKSLKSLRLGSEAVLDGRKLGITSGSNVSSSKS